LFLSNFGSLSICSSKSNQKQYSHWSFANCIAAFRQFSKLSKGFSLIKTGILFFSPQALQISIVLSVDPVSTIQIPSTIVFIPTAAMSICSLAAAYTGHFFLACAAIFLSGLAFRLVLSLEEAGK
jgi:hypothetical protein